MRDVRIERRVERAYVTECGYTDRKYIYAAQSRLIQCSTVAWRSTVAMLWQSM